MNTHLNDGQLRAALDGELNATDLGHLQGCDACQQRQRQINAQMQRVAALFIPTAPAAVPDAHQVLRRFHLKYHQKEIPMFKKLFASSVFRYAAIAVLLIAVTLSFPQTRALASQLLSLFRVQQVTVLPIDFTGMKQLTGQSPVGEEISKMLSSSMTVTQKAGEPVVTTNAAEASQLAGFNLRLPQGEKFSQITVTQGSAFTFTIDQVKAQALLDEVGRNDLILPTSINGKQVSVTIPAGVSVAFGTCPDPKAAEASGGDFGPGSPGRLYADCILLAEIPSPTVSAPAEVNVAQLAQIGLEFTGMSREEAAAYTASVDWTSTLVIPIPKNAATYKQVSVDGVMGTLIERPSDDEPQFSLVWVKDGIIYAIGGLGGKVEQALHIANSLP